MPLSALDVSRLYWHDACHKESAVEILQTPEERFERLADYPFAPHYQSVTDADGTALRIHYLDEGPRDAAPVLLLHGEPSWSYLYRKFVPPLTAAGHRVIAPDLIGFGKSDKPAARADYTYERHVAWMSDWLTALDLQGITLFCQDWGGLIGLRLVAAFPDRFARLVVANTGLPVGSGSSAGFDAWLAFSQNVPLFPVGAIVNGGTTRELSADEIAAYDAPFPDERYKEGARQFPTLVPITPEHASVAENRAAWTVLERFDKPVLTAFSDKDAVTAGGEKIFIERIPGARGQPHTIITGGGHFLQEDAPEQLSTLIDSFIRSTGAPA
ncbi:MAG: haloalkane dehalogenase [Sphingomonas echinoides]